VSLWVYNTLSGKLEEFQTITPGEVKMYVCGPTVYDNSHIGHAMSALVYDIIRRYLEYRDYRVQHAQNFTDIDDKIIRRAAELDIPWNELTEKYVNQFLEWMDALNVKRATVYPRATIELDNIITTIEKLIDKGHAYPARNGDVYYRVSTKSEYGELKHQSVDELLVGARIAPDEAKENALDFALWKAAKPGEPSWESPWGPGRPGWHIECTAMAIEHLGEQLDIHGGGADLIFPHHENEIAQSEAYTGKRPFVRYWLHNGLLQMGSDKMSKSLGNFVTVGDILKEYDADTLRFFVLGSLYRNPLKFTDESFQSAEKGLQRMKAVFDPAEKWGDPTSSDGNEEANQKLQKLAEQARKSFVEAMDNDFNTAIALATLFDLVRDIFREREQGASGFSLFVARQTLLDLGNVLGLRLDKDTRPKLVVNSKPFQELLDTLGSLFDGSYLPAFSEQLIAGREEIERNPETDQLEEANRYVRLLVETRSALKKARQFQLADNIRDRLKDLGVKLEDRPDGTIWKFEK
jgi:cysteinyl-tRNA synthetase